MASYQICILFLLNVLMSGDDMDCANKYTLHIRMDMNKKPKESVLCGWLMNALLLYAKKTDTEITVYKAYLEEET